jgi:hypothetical protein
VHARRGELRAHPHRPERDALEAIAEQVAVLRGIGAPEVGERRRGISCS